MSDPLERIVRTFDAAAFKQAAAVMDQMDAGRQAALSVRAIGRGRCARRPRAISIADCCSRRSVCTRRRWPRMGKRRGARRPGRGARAQRRCDAARKEAQASLELGPSANAYLVLAQLDLAAGNLGTANTDAGNALKLDPANRAAQDILRQILARTGQK